MAEAAIISQRLQATSQRLRAAVQAPEHARAIFLLGMVGSMLGSIMYLALLEVAWKNFHGEAAIIWQPLATLTNALVWSGYGCLIRNRYIWMPNALGALVALLTILAAF